VWMKSSFGSEKSSRLCTREQVSGDPRVLAQKVESCQNLHDGSPCLYFNTASAGACHRCPPLPTSAFSELGRTPTRSYPTNGELHLSPPALGPSAGTTCGIFSPS
jgi:hypothetical protein